MAEWIFKNIMTALRTGLNLTCLSDEAVDNEPNHFDETFDEMERGVRGFLIES
jgi:hypothetical protein